MHIAQYILVAYTLCLLHFVSRVHTLSTFVDLRLDRHSIEEIAKKQNKHHQPSQLICVFYVCK